jgi:hypothetical protein
VIGVPVVYGPGEAVFVIERSAAARVIVVDAVEVLLAGTVSVDVDVTFAVLGSAPAGAASDTFATIVNVAVTPLARLAIVHVTVPFVPTVGFVQRKAGPVFCVVETNVVFGGRASERETPVAAFGPLFVREMLYVTLVPAAAVGVAVFVTARSASTLTVVFAVELLFAAFTSFAAATLAVFETTVAAAGPLTFSVKTSVPIGIESRVQVTVPVPLTAGVVQLQPAAGTSDANVVPAGMTSVSETFSAGFGPPLVTLIV